jgi:hypothetical protein
MNHEVYILFMENDKSLAHFCRNITQNIRTPVSSRGHNVTGTVTDFIHELGFLTPVTLTRLRDNRSPLVTVLQNTYQYLMSAHMVSIFPTGPVLPKRGTSVLGSPGG